MPTTPEQLKLDPAVFAEVDRAAEASMRAARDPANGVPSIILPEINRVRADETPVEAHLRLQREQGFTE